MNAQLSDIPTRAREGAARRTIAAGLAIGVTLGALVFAVLVVAVSATDSPDAPSTRPVANVDDESTTVPSSSDTTASADHRSTHDRGGARPDRSSRR